jgi:two-component system chemotaxis response regulator CheB
MSRAPRVLVVDDSSVIRGILSRGLAAHGLDVVGGAGDPFAARDLIFSTKPDVLTLDIEMPLMNGLTFLERLMAFRPMPVVVLSSLAQEGSVAALKALELGAVEVVSKPAHHQAFEAHSSGLERLAALIHAVGLKQLQPRWTSRLKQAVTHPAMSSGAARKILAVGASTGGPAALSVLMEAPPPPGCACVIVQHLPPGFSQGFAQRLGERCPWRVREARHGELLTEGSALIAPADRHVAIKRVAEGWVTQLLDTPPLNFVKPSVDILFQSVASAAGASALGVLLTGMGRDGAVGLLAMRKAGAHTLAQDEASSVVWGMPKEAIQMGGAVEVLALEDMAKAVSRALSKHSQGASPCPA